MEKSHQAGEYGAEKQCWQGAKCLACKGLTRMEREEKDDVKGERHDHEIPSEPIDRTPGSPGGQSRGYELSGRNRFIFHYQLNTSG